jgi:sugar lactone lactonase YvrE
MRIHFILLLAISLCTGCGVPSETDSASAKTGELEVSDYTAPGTFTDGIEGPATDAEGNIYAVNYKKQGTIGKVNVKGEASLFVTLPEGSTGNGIRIDKKGNFYVADYTGHNILYIDKTTKDISVFAHSDAVHQPNDLTLAPDGTLYASDPNWADSTGQLWKVTAAGFELLKSDMGTTNGIEVGRDGKKLYVSESVQRKIWVFDIESHRELINKQLFHEFPDFAIDGIRLNVDGNLYVTRHGKGTVAVLSPKGELINEIFLKGKKPTNLTFSPNYSRCYVTLADRGCIEVIDLVLVDELTEEEKELLELLPAVL